MKFTDLPLNVPVVIALYQNDIVCWEIIRLSDTEEVTRVLGSDEWVNYPAVSYYWVDIIDAPTDSDAAECGVVAPLTLSPHPHFTTTIYLDAFRYGLDSGAIMVSAPSEQKLCTCPLYGPVSLLATGCRCGGK